MPGWSNSKDKDRGIYDCDEAVELTGNGKYSYLLLVTCCIISNAVAVDMFGFSLVVAAATCDLQLGISETGLLASSPFVGVIFAFPWGYYADTRGRRRALLLSTIVGFIFAAVSSISSNWQVMLALKIIGCSFPRFLIGGECITCISSAASFTLCMAYLGESIGSKYRSRYLFIMNSMNLASEIVSFGLAYFILPLTFYLPIPWLMITFRSWRLFTLILALPMGIGALLLLFLYESPKFLANKGKTEEALKTLKKIYIINGGKDEEFPLKDIKQGEDMKDKDSSVWSSLVVQTVPLFRPPLLWRTIQLFYLLVLCCTTNNVFLMWFPTMVNIFFKSLSAGTTNIGFCDAVTNNITFPNEITNDDCNDTISSFTIYVGLVLGVLLTAINLAASALAKWRSLVLIGCFTLSAVSGVLVGAVNQPAVSMVFFVLIQITTVGIGSVASYFVDLYPTSHRGLVTSLGMMVARLSSLAGVNLIGAVITDHCNWTFFCWSIFVLSGVPVALFLPSESKIKK